MKTIVASSILAVTVLGIYTHHASQDPCEVATSVALESNYTIGIYPYSESPEYLYAKCVWARATGGVK